MVGDDLTIVLFFIGTAISVAAAAMSQAGWKHRILIYGMFAVAAIMAALGALWPLIKGWSPQITGVVAPVATSPVSWFSLIILTLSLRIAVGRYLNPLSQSQSVVETSGSFLKKLSPEEKIHQAIFPTTLGDDIRTLEARIDKITTDIDIDISLIKSEYKQLTESNKTSSQKTYRDVQLDILHTLNFSLHQATATVLDHLIDSAPLAREITLEQYLKNPDRLDLARKYINDLRSRLDRGNERYFCLGAIRRQCRKCLAPNSTRTQKGNL
jgi:hypothetical protein